MEALNTVRISERDQEHAFQMIASVLWLRNIMFQVVDNESHVEVVQSEVITNAASLIGVILALSTCHIQASKDKVAKSLTVEQATDRRDTLAKFIYANSFDWIVHQMNRNLAMGKEQMGRSINVLDSYGFESFKLSCGILGLYTLLKILLAASFLDVHARTDVLHFKNMNWTELIGQK